jgi:AcrR family transcriptional regulator
MLDTALELFSEHGYLGVRVEDIAKRSGVSRATFYKHFSEREQILAELFERLLGTASEQEPGSGPVEQQVVAAIEGAVARMLEQEQLARFVYSLPVRHSALLRPGVRATPYVFDQVTRLLEQGGHREIRPTSPPCCWPATCWQPGPPCATGGGEVEAGRVRLLWRSASTASRLGRTRPRAAADAELTYRSCCSSNSMCVVVDQRPIRSWTVGHAARHERDHPGSPDQPQAPAI